MPEPRSKATTLYREYKLMNPKMKKYFLLAYGGKFLKQTLKLGGIAFGLYFFFATPIMIAFGGWGILSGQVTGAMGFHFAAFFILLLFGGAGLLIFCLDQGSKIYDNIKSATFLVEKHLEDVGYKEKE